MRPELVYEALSPHTRGLKLLVYETLSMHRARLSRQTNHIDTKSTSQMTLPVVLCQLPPGRVCSSDLALIFSFSFSFPPPLVETVPADMSLDPAICASRACDAWRRCAEETLIVIHIWIAGE
jgi:hypothetical protein